MTGKRTRRPGSAQWLLIAALSVQTVAWGADTPKTDEKGTDRVYVNVARSNLRSGPGAQFNSVGVVAAGQELEVVAITDDWLKVSAGGSKPAWIIRRATTTTPPTPVVVKNLEKKISGLQSENDELGKEIRRLSDARQDLELQASQLKSDVMLLTSRNEELKSWRTVLWVFLGLVVLLTGWVLGFLAGTFRRQADDKRYDTLMKEAASKKA